MDNRKCPGCGEVGKSSWAGLMYGCINDKCRVHEYLVFPGDADDAGYRIDVTPGKVTNIPGDDEAMLELINVVERLNERTADMALYLKTSGSRQGDYAKWRHQVEELVLKLKKHYQR